jgi:hypothetical protein
MKPSLLWLQVILFNINITVLTYCAEFILPQFFGGRIPSFTSQFFQGFFTTVLLDSIAVNVVDIIYGQMINVVQPGSLAYYLYEDSKGHQFMSRKENFYKWKYHLNLSYFRRYLHGTGL